MGEGNQLLARRRSQVKCSWYGETTHAADEVIFRQGEWDKSRKYAPGHTVAQGSRNGDSMTVGASFGQTLTACRKDNLVRLKLTPRPRDDKLIVLLFDGLDTIGVSNRDRRFVCSA